MDLYSKSEGNGKELALERIASRFDRFINEGNIPKQKIAEFLSHIIDEYGTQERKVYISLEPQDPDFSFHSIEPLNELPDDKNYSPAYSVTHPLTAARIIEILSDPLPPAHTLSATLMHDVLEESYSNQVGLFPRSFDYFLQDWLNLAEEIFGIPGDELHDLGASVKDLSRLRGENYGHYLERIIVQKKLFFRQFPSLGKSWLVFAGERLIEYLPLGIIRKYYFNRDDVLIPSLVAKAMGDMLDNSTSVGDWKLNLKILSDRHYEYVGLDYNSRSNLIHKNMLMINILGKYFNRLMQDLQCGGQIPSQYQNIFRSLYFLHEITIYQVRRMGEYVDWIYQHHPDERARVFYPERVDALGKALREYEKNNGLDSKTQQQGKFESLLIEYEINQNIYHGTLNEVSHGVEAPKRRVYGDILRPENGLKLKAHLMVLERVLDRFFPEEGDYFVVVRGFSGLRDNVRIDSPSGVPRYDVLSQIQQTITNIFS